MNNNIFVIKEKCDFFGFINILNHIFYFGAVFFLSPPPLYILVINIYEEASWLPRRICPLVRSCLNLVVDPRSFPAEVIHVRSLSPY